MISLVSWLSFSLICYYNKVMVTEFHLIIRAIINVLLGKILDFNELYMTFCMLPMPFPFGGLDTWITHTPHPHPNIIQITEVILYKKRENASHIAMWKIWQMFHHKHQGLDPLIRSISRVTTACANASLVFQMFSFLVVYSSMISKEFGFVAFFASVEASSVCIQRPVLAPKVYYRCR